MISFHRLSTIAVILMLAACTNPRGEHLAVTDTSITAPSSLKSSMAVGQVTGGGSYLFDPDAVRDSEFKAALQKSLVAHGLLAEGSPAYLIDANIGTHLSDGSVTEDKQVDETVEYRVIRKADQKNFMTTIKTSYVLPGTKIAASGVDTGAGWALKKSNAYDKVTADNLTQFMQTLAAWDQGRGQ